MKVFNVVLLIIIVGSFSNCASTQRTTTTETRTVYDDDTVAAYDDDVVVEKRVREDAHRTGRSGGILSSTVNFIGDVIAFPFRLIGGLLRAIF